MTNGRVLLAVAVVAALVQWTACPVAAATQIDIVGPLGSGSFGTSVKVLPNGNIVVTDPMYDDGATANVGAMHLYDGATGALISTLTGSTAGDQVGSGGVTVLSNGNYVVHSRYWDNGAATDAGAVTWGDGAAGVNGVVSAANSLVGNTANDQVGRYRVTTLSNGNYVAPSPYWDNGAAADAGAVTWGHGATGVNGVVSAANSLVGSKENDRVGYDVTALGNGNYVVLSRYWDNGTVVDAGAVTWGSGMIGVNGVVSAANSLVGSKTDDQVGRYDVTALSNGNYVVRSPDWDHGPVADAGAATWGNGEAGVTGPIWSANSLVGSTPGDEVGANVTALSNGNYLVRSVFWDNGTAADAGAVTWGDGTAGVAGIVSAANSLVGSQANDQVGLYGVSGLSNGNYVVLSPAWDNGAITDAGAATWGNGSIGIAGPVSAANSLVGTKAGDQVGWWTEPLSNGNYVVFSRLWDNGAATDAGAVTWGNGGTGINGAVSTANSLVGSKAGDQVGYSGVTALSNGNYVVLSPYWDNGAAADAGAVTWGNGTVGIVGPVSAANSLVGSKASDQVGYYGVTELTNANYVVPSPYWDNGAAADAGAVTWGNGTTGSHGMVSAANSLVGSKAGDQVGINWVTALSNGHYVVSSPWWDNGTAVDVGAVTWGDGTTGIVGPVSTANSLVGSMASDYVGVVTALSNGNYVVSSAGWDYGPVTDAGAVTWGNGMTGISGPVSAANSLVGSTPGDLIGSDGVTALTNGNYVVVSPGWANGPTWGAGAVTWGSGMTGVAGPITVENSVLGATADGGSSMIWAYDYANHQLVVGRPADNTVTLFRPFCPPVFLPVLLKGGL